MAMTRRSLPRGMTRKEESKIPRIRRPSAPRWMRMAKSFAVRARTDYMVSQLRGGIRVRSGSSVRFHPPFRWRWIRVGRLCCHLESEGSLEGCEVEVDFGLGYRRKTYFHLA